MLSSNNKIEAQLSLSSVRIKMRYNLNSIKCPHYHSPQEKLEALNIKGYKDKKNFLFSLSVMHMMMVASRGLGLPSLVLLFEETRK